MYSSIHPLISALDGGEWSASSSGNFTPKERALGTHWIGGWVGSRAVLDAVVKKNLSPRRETNPRTAIVQLDSLAHRWMNRESSVGIVLGYGLDNRGSRVRFPVGAGNFSLHRRVQNCSGTHPGSYPMGTRGSFPGREADHSPPSSVEVKEWVELYLHSPIRLHGVVLSSKTKHRDTFTLAHRCSCYA
jgi:hypothetical protein